mmetsp:Transcript_27659/g.31685  ORF Transcript_27659/g.31685 Transcript_27659/m.31685 type:complete len:218 (-) Transcript_27659:1815-2468(-)
MIYHEFNDDACCLKSDVYLNCYLKRIVKRKDEVQQKSDCSSDLHDVMKLDCLNEVVGVTNDAASHSSLCYHKSWSWYAVSHTNNDDLHNDACRRYWIVHGYHGDFHFHFEGLKLHGVHVVVPFDKCCDGHNLHACSLDNFQNQLYEIAIHGRIALGDFENFLDYFESAYFHFETQHYNFGSVCFRLENYQDNCGGIYFRLENYYDQLGDVHIRFETC